MNIKRRKARVVHVGPVAIGGNHPISVQSMTNTDTRDVGATLAQIVELEKAGCEIIRLGIPDMDAAEKFGEIKSRTKTPLIADIHFDYKLALKVIEKGVDGLRINPGNIGEKKRVQKVVEAAGKNNLSIRIGVNAGSLEKDLEGKYKENISETMRISALKHIRILEEMDFYDIKISLKASNVLETIEAYQLLAKDVDYPFHIGISESGTLYSGTIKSSVGLGILLAQGIGDTIRVSLTSNPVDEVKAGFEILKALGLRKQGINIISCPTCSRQEIDVISLASEIEKRLSHIKKPVDIAVMGCVVNGPGESKRADIGVAGGKNLGVIYKKGKITKKVKLETRQQQEKLIEDLQHEINKTSENS